eukprot:COSAG02_NODE_17324_length_1012_cov_1.250821_1_plen_53_part_10
MNPGKYETPASIILMIAITHEAIQLYSIRLPYYYRATMIVIGIIGILCTREYL